MKFCTLLICCVSVLMAQNVFGGSKNKSNGAIVENPKQPNPNNTNTNTNTTQQLLDLRNLSKIKSHAKLYEDVKKTEPGNFVLSPLSLRNALAMLSLGAAGETAKEILESLKSKNNNQLIQRQSNLTSLLKEISSGNSSVKFVTANKIYATDGLTIKTEYEKDVKKLGGEIETVDFGNAEEAAGKINSWVKNKTEGKIEKLVDSSDLNSQTSLFVLNAIYFKGLWENPFEETSTRKTQFFINGSCSVNVSMMYQKNEFQLADLEDAKAQVILLPYEGERLSMMIYLPNGKEESSLDFLENWLKDKSPFDIQKQYLSSNSIGDVSLSLPKFKIRSSLDLMEPLKNLGLGKMFDSATANFSGIFNGSGRFFVSKVSQETFIEVNEEGTEAAAATGFGLSATSFSGTPTPEFTADRPFLFQIVDSGTKTVLFTGRVKNPLDSAEASVSAGEENEPLCNILKPTEPTTVSQSPSESKMPGAPQNETTDSRDENPNSTQNQKPDVEKILKSFCNLQTTTAPNSTEDVENNRTAPAAGLQMELELAQCLTGFSEEKERVLMKNKHLKQTVEDLQSKIQELEQKQMCNNTLMSQTPTRTTTTTTREEEPQGKLSSFPTATAHGDYWGVDEPLSWNYSANANGTCSIFSRAVYSVKIKASSCVALYKDVNCSKDKFRTITSKSSNSSSGQETYYFHKNDAKLIKAIGVCS